MAQHHVHVYKVSSLLEFEVDADSEEEAMEEAIKRADERKRWKKADCKMMACIPHEEA